MNKKKELRKGLMLVLSSPSGAGKTSICKKVISLDKEISMSVSYTTRPKRKSEKEGMDYFFISRSKFENLKNNNFFIEYANVFDHWYGTPKTFIEGNLKNGEDVIFDIDWQGADQIKNKKLDYKLITFYILPPSKNELFERLSNRDMKDKLIAEERMRQFERDVLHWINYDYVVVNDNLDTCFAKIKNLIDAEASNGSKDYDLQFIRNHVKKLTS